MKYIISLVLLIISLIYLNTYSYPRQKSIQVQFVKDTAYINNYMRHPIEGGLNDYLLKEIEMEDTYHELVWLYKIDEIIYVVIFLIITYLLLCD